MLNLKRRSILIEDESSSCLFIDSNEIRLQAPNVGLPALLVTSTWRDASVEIQESY